MLTDGSDDAVGLWREAFDTVGEVQHTVIYLHPLKHGAQPPPGLTRWPAPGEVMLSPELVREGKREGITSRYGQYVGTVSKSGLVSPSERLAYVGPAQAPDPQKTESWRYVRGFGQFYPMGEALNSRPLSQLLLALAALAGLPAMALLVVAARVGSRTRDHRSSLLQALGGTWRHRALVNVGEAALPVAAGTLLALAPMAVAMTTDLRVPPTGYLLNSADLRTAWPVVIVALLLSFTVTLAVVVLLHRVGRDGNATRPRSFSSNIPRWRLFGCGAGVAAVVFSQYLSGKPGLVTFVVGTVVMWALLPSVAVVACRRLGASIASRGGRMGRPGQLIGGRWTVAHPGVVIRLALAMIIGLGLVCQLQVWNSRLDDKATAARFSQARVGDSVVSVRSRDITQQAIESLGRALPAGSRVLVVTTDPEQPAPLLQGSCPALKSLGLPCPTVPSAAVSNDRRLSEVRRWYGTSLHVQMVPSTPRYNALHSSLLVTTAIAGQSTQVARTAYALIPAVNVETLGETWLVGAATKARLNNWVLLFGSLGLSFLLVTGTLSAAAEFVRVRRVLSPLAVLADSSRVFKSVAWWHLTMPLLISTVIAGIVTAWHSVFFIAVAQEGEFAWGVLAAAMSGCAVVSVAVGILGGRSAIRAAQQWRPTAD